MGSFIAALRRANGMTQKDLAQRLSVSDKAVSRWEREESLPDLTMIPVLAEVFGVTADELLRGEKQANAADSAEGAEGVSRPAQERVKKQTARLINASLNRASLLQYGAAGLGALAVITALVCNFALERGFLGFCLAAVLILCGAAFSVISARSALRGAQEEEIAPR